jgi:hypothetical protein
MTAEDDRILLTRADLDAIHRWADELAGEVLAGRLTLAEVEALILARVKDAIARRAQA